MNKEKEMKNGVVNRISKNKKQLIGKEISKGGTRIEGVERLNRYRSVSYTHLTLPTKA